MRLLQTEERTREKLQPCRVLSPGEAAKQKRKMAKDNKHSMAGKTTVIQYLKFPDVDEGLYKCVDDTTLIPFGYTSKDGLSTTFNDAYLQRYMQQQSKTTGSSDLEATRLFLTRLFNHARETERKSRARAKKDLEDYYEDSSSSSASDDNNGSSNKKVADSKKAKAATTTTSRTKSSTLLSKRSSDSVEIVNGNKSKITSKIRPSPSIDLSSSDGSDDETSYQLRSSKKVLDSKRVQFGQFEVVENTDDNDDDDEANDDMDELDVPYTQAITFDPDDFGPDEEQSNEPIRPGDVIEYYSPIFVAGDARGLRQATVLAVDPNDDSPLALSNGDVLPNNTKAKRIKAMCDGELLDHPGIYRPIYKFKLTKRGKASAATGIAMEAARFGRIMQKNISKMKKKAEADGFAPMDMLVNIKGVNSRADETSSEKPLSGASSRGKKRESLLSSSDDSDDEIVTNKQKRRTTMKPQSKKTSGTTNSRTTKPNNNKENNRTASAAGKGKRMSLGSLSSSASLGSSLASSDDSSIESTSANLESSRKKMAHCAKSASSKGKKPNAKTYDLSLSSDDDNADSIDVLPKKKMGKDTKRCNTPEKARSSNDSVDSARSLETPNSLGLSKKSTSNKPSSTSSFGSSKRRLKLGATGKNQSVAPSSSSSSSSSLHGNNGKSKKKGSARKATRGRSVLPASPSSPSSSSSDDSSTSSNLQSSRPYRKQAKAAATTKSRTKSSTRTLLSKRSSDAVEIVNGNKSKITSKKRPSPSIDLSSSDVSDDETSYQMRSCKTVKKQLLKQSSNASGSISSETGKKSAREEVSTGQQQQGDMMNNFGWTQGTAGWRKSAAGGTGFSFSRSK